MATPAATASALHGDPTAYHGNPHGTPTSTAPIHRLRLPRLGLVLVSGFHGMPWKILPQVVPCHGMSRKRTIMYIGFVTPPVHQTCARGRRLIPFGGACLTRSTGDTDCIVSMISSGRAFSSLNGNEEDGDGASSSRKDLAHVGNGGANSASQEENLQSSSVEQIGSRRRLKGSWK